MNSDTPIGISSYSVNEVVKLVPEQVAGLPSAKVRLNYVKMLYDVLGFELTPDIALASVAEPQAELVISTAGGGKTTWSQIKAIEQKCIRKDKNGKKLDGHQILCLVYNKHNVEDMRRKHAKMVTRLMTAGINGLDIDASINSCTMHSFCDFFRKRFAVNLGLVGFSIADDSELVAIMHRAVIIVGKMRKTADYENISCDKLVQLYTLTKETLSSVEECHNTDVYTDLMLEDDELCEIFTRYDAMKATSRKYSFVDILYSLYELMQRDVTVLNQIQQYYSYVIADEVQDFTPLMWKILQLFVSDGTPLTCIGDEDQNLYSFRGADVKYLLDFKEMFPNGKVYTLNENRRCKGVILNEAKRVIQGNTLRFDKEIIGRKQGGDIRCMPYSTPLGEVAKVVDFVKSMPPDELCKTVICYRNSESSMLLVDSLAEAGVSLNCLRANMPYSHELYRHFLDVLLALESPLDRDVYKNLWKVLPCKKAEFFEAIHYDPKSRRFTSIDEKTHFADFNYGKLMRYNGFGDAIQALRTFSDDITTMTMDSYFPCIEQMLNLYFWNYKRTLSENEMLDDIYEKKVNEHFCVHKTFSEVFSDMQRLRGLCKNNTDTGTGVTLSTFHSLKGLEFKNVIAVDMDNDIFPNYSMIEYKKYPYDVEVTLKEAETRLWYVAITRATDNLIIFYNESNPSVYVQSYLNEKNDVSVKADVVYGISESDFADAMSDCDRLVEDDFAEEDFAEEEAGTITFGQLKQGAIQDEVQSVGDGGVSAIASFDTEKINVQNETTGDSRFLASLFAQLA